MPAFNARHGRSLCFYLWISQSLSRSRERAVYATVRRVAKTIALTLLLPLLVLTDSPDRIRRRLFHEHPEHDGCCSRQGVPRQFCISSLWIRQFSTWRKVWLQVILRGIAYLPSKNILCMVISQIHFSWPTYWDTYSLSIISF